jgi:hypothetical protein
VAIAALGKDRKPLPHFDLGAAALYEEVMRQLLLAVANADARPAWKPDSFFRRYATGAP